METIVLMGSDDVQRAGANMQDAAETMRRAADAISFALEQHQRFMDDWLARLEAVLAAKEGK